MNMGQGNRRLESKGSPLPGALAFRFRREAARKRGPTYSAISSDELTSLNKKEVGRFETLLMLDRGLITTGEAQQLLNVGRSQMFKLLKRYRLHGAAAVGSKKRGRASNNAYSSTVRRTVLAIIEKNYLDYGPTLTAEVLFEIHGIRLSAETVRQWRLESGLWLDDRVARKRIHVPRGRSLSFGELLQIDGSDHRWLGYRAPSCTLMVCVDDATGMLTALHFCPRENREAYLRATIGHLEKYGRPVRILSDKHSAVYSRKHDSFYTKALSQLGVLHAFAHTPQSKGRVERMNRTLQDRLVKALSRAGARSIEQANAYAPHFIADFNSKFAQAPRDGNDDHRPLLHPNDARRAFTEKFERRVSRNLTFSFRGERYIVKPEPNQVGLARKQISIEIDSDGRASAYFNDTMLNISIG